MYGGRAPKGERCNKVCMENGKMARFGLCAASSLISEERGVCCSYFILCKVVDRVIFNT